jgi:hypothetical protein
LKELNPDVQGGFIVHDVEKFVYTQAETIKKYHLVIASELSNVKL